MSIGREPHDEREHLEVDDHGMVSEEEDYTATRLNQVSKIREIVWLVVGIIEIIIGIRVLLLLLAANPDNPFASFMYRLSRVFVWPFYGLVAEPAANGSVLEISSLIAMLVYLLLGWIAVKLVQVIMVPSEVRRTRTVHRH